MTERENGSRFADLADWNPLDHPRDGHGRFSSGGGGGGGGSEAKRDWSAEPLHPSLLNGTNDTESLHSKVRADGKREYNKERKALHDAIVSKFISGHSATDDPPKALFTAGGPAAGKSSGLKRVPELVPGDAVDINPDLVKEELPEFAKLAAIKDPNAAAKVHEESSSLAKRVQSEAAAKGLNMVNDGTGNGKPGGFVGKIRKVKEKGYDVSVVYADVPTDVAVERARLRAENQKAKGQTPRQVPESFIRNAHKSVAANFPGVVDEPGVSRIVLFDNSGGANDPPTKVAEKTGDGPLNVLDEGLYKRFLEKADETWEPDVVAASQTTENGKSSREPSSGSPATTTGWTNRIRYTRPTTATLTAETDSSGRGGALKETVLEYLNQNGAENAALLDMTDEDLDAYLVVSLAEMYTKPGTANVSPDDRKKLAPLLKHYAKMEHPFTACKRDQLKHGLSEDHANRRCAVLKDLIKGTTKWRGKDKADMSAWPEEDFAEFALTAEDAELVLNALYDFAAVIEGEEDADLAFNPSQLRDGQGKWTSTGGGSGQPQDNKGLLTGLKAGNVNTKQGTPAKELKKGSTFHDSKGAFHKLGWIKVGLVKVKAIDQRGDELEWGVGDPVEHPYLPKRRMSLAEEAGDAEADAGDLAAEGEGALKKGDAVTWGSGQGAGYGRLLEIYTDSGKAVIEPCEYFPGEAGGLNPTGGKAEKNVKDLRKSSIHFVGENRIGPELSVPDAVKNSVVKAMWEARQTHPRVERLTLDLADGAISREQAGELTQALEEAEETERALLGGDEAAEWLAELTDLTFNPSQLRDGHGKWTSGGGGESRGSSSEPEGKAGAAFKPADRSALLKGLDDAATKLEADRKVPNALEPLDYSNAERTIKLAKKLVRGLTGNVTRRDAGDALNKAAMQGGTPYAVKMIDDLRREWKLGPHPANFSDDGEATTDLADGKLGTKKVSALKAGDVLVLGNKTMEVESVERKGERVNFTCKGSSKKYSYKATQSVFTRDRMDMAEDSENPFSGLTVQLPLDFSEAEEVDLSEDLPGRRRWRKQILPFGKINYKGKVLDFSKKFGEQLVESFKKRPLDQVPFILVDKENRHNSDPDRVRGWVEGVSLGDDGVYATLETNARGTEHLTEVNPKLGTSVRVRFNYKRASDNKFFGPVLEHLAGTTLPHVPGMKPFVPADLAMADMSEQGDLLEAGVEDLTSCSFITADGGAGEPSGEGGDDPTQETDGPQENTQRTDENKEVTLSVNDQETRKDELDLSDVPEDLQPQWRKLVEENQRAMDLAQAASDKLASQKRERYEEKVDLTLAEYQRAGITKAVADLARPILKGAQASEEMVVDFAEDGTEVKASVSDLVYKIMDEIKGDTGGRVEYGERGVSDFSKSPADLSEEDLMAEIDAHLDDAGYARLEEPSTNGGVSRG